mgnify:CR=1 FL=1
MKLYVCKNYDEMSETAAQIISSVITLKPDCVLGLATGSTPVGTYSRLADMNRAGKLDFTKVRTYNLDEYYPIKPSNPQSYRYFMDKHLFDLINIDKSNTHLLNGEAPDTEVECAAYDRAIESAGGIDIQLLGIGNNGHVGFNEPSEKLTAATHKTSLTESTINANARFFASAVEVPRHALTMGLAPIMKARKIILLASGKNKHAALSEMLSGVIATSNLSTVLNLHSDVTVVCDADAYNG